MYIDANNGKIPIINSKLVYIVFPFYSCADYDEI